eukprot:SAG31_NODE_6864_length_1866_cov_1.806452_1_plen_166_part_00
MTGGLLLWSSLSVSTASDRRRGPAGRESSSSKNKARRCAEVVAAGVNRLSITVTPHNFEGITPTDHISPSPAPSRSAPSFANEQSLAEAVSSIYARYEWYPPSGLCRVYVGESGTRSHVRAASSTACRRSSSSVHRSSAARGRKDPLPLLCTQLYGTLPKFISSY